jgi:hypothetical protein
MGADHQGPREAGVRAYGRREVLALALAVGAAACSGQGTPSGGAEAMATAASSTPAAPSPKVTIEDAEQALARFLATDDVIRAAGDERLATELARDAQLPLTVAHYRSSEMSPPRYTWGDARLLVPRLDRAPYWFTAVVERRAGKGAARTAVLTLTRPDEDGHWQLAFSSLLYPDATVPDAALDADGYATALDAGDESVEISPRLMAPLHATIAEEGSQGFTAGLITPGTHTSGYAAEIESNRHRAKLAGYNYDSIFSATDFPVYTLRAADGGAIIQYSMARTTTLTSKTADKELIPVPEEARWAIGVPVVHRELRVQETQQYVSVTPPAKSGAATTVIAYDGAITRVSGV